MTAASPQVAFNIHAGRDNTFNAFNIAVTRQNGDGNNKQLQGCPKRNPSSSEELCNDYKNRTRKRYAQNFVREGSF